MLRALIWVAVWVAIGFGLGRCAFAHDWKHPNYDQWYGSLQRPNVGNAFGGGQTCCSKTDCHETEAEIRGTDWWARLGLPHTRDDGGTDWDLADWVQVPADKVLPNTSNPTGNAVICHSIDRLMSGGINPQASIWCFIPASES